jgi:sugar fermentation stimulation protein A
MLFGGDLKPALFKARPNRFLGEVEIDGERSLCFIPNPGRMKEFLHLDAKVYVQRKPSGHRKTSLDLVLVDLDGILISVDSRVPNNIVAEAIEAGHLTEFQGMKIEKKETTFEDSRLDFGLSGSSVHMLLEVKSCTLVKDGVALFPDAPTRRGRRHLHTLISALDLGRAAILFLIQRSDAKAFAPNQETDPLFSEALREAAEEGVEVYAYNSNVTLHGLSIGSKLPVILRLYESTNPSIALF